MHFCVQFFFYYLIFIYFFINFFYFFAQELFLLFAWNSLASRAIAHAMKKKIEETTTENKEQPIKTGKRKYLILILGKLNCI